MPPGERVRVDKLDSVVLKNIHWILHTLQLAAEQQIAQPLAI